MPQAEYHLGLLYQNGQWVEKSLDQAAFWFDKAAQQNLSEAKLILSELAIKEPDDVELYVAN